VSLFAFVVQIPGASDVAVRAAMAGLTRKNVRPLLRAVNGKRHATDDDHEEPTGKRRADSEAFFAKQQEESDINADPLSSDDELRAPPPRSAKPSKPSMPASHSVDTELKRPPRKPVNKGASIRAPTRGAYQNSEELKVRNGKIEDKENTLTSAQASASKGPIRWGMEHVSQKNNKNVKGYGSKTKNIHTPAPKRFGKGPSKPAARTNGSASQSKGTQPSQEYDSDSSVSMLDDDELDKLAKEMGEPKMADDSGLRRVGSKVKSTKAKDKNAETVPYDDDKLSEVLDSISEQPMSEKLKKAAKTAQLMKQLSSWKESHDVPSSQPDSSIAQEHLDEVSNYIERLPSIEEEGSRCLLCSQHVSPTDYWTFWKGKDKTVRNKSAFCHLHKKLSAQKAYKQAGYPEVDWTTLPSRLRRNKATLSQILHNERPSRHRARYEPLALTGKAAAVPSKRADLSTAQQEELDSYALDERAAYPGYYGPHGRRLITENIMDLLKSEIKRCKDGVVQASGIAAFVQAVMVPEAAVLLIMEDCGIDSEEAEGVREDTYEMGLLVHEEIEDEVVRRPEDESEEENEYHIM
jgi:hypothetical protein